MSFRTFIAFLILPLLTYSSLYPAIYTVINVGDTGVGSLRQAIVDANTNPGLDTIQFGITVPGTKTITLLSALPNITDSIFIDGASDPFYAGTPLIEVNVNGLAFTSGLTLAGTAPGSHIKALIINNATSNGNGIVVLANDTKITGCYIGTNATGTAAVTNAFAGIEAQFVDNLTIGGTGANEGNVISGNGLYGIRMTLVDTADIVGNIIGADAAGTTGIANGTGIITFSTTELTVGGNTAAHRNLISGNGVGIDHTGKYGYFYGNYIGTDINGTAALANSTGLIVKADSNQVGGTVTGQGNVISGNNFSGISITSSNAFGNQIQGNLIGTDNTGTAAIPNGGNGIDLSNSARLNTIGGLAAASANLISGNTGAGIGLTVTDSNYVYGNYIGTDINGTAALSNQSHGISIVSATHTFIGNATAAGANVISGNGNNGILISGISVDSTIVKFNYIGTDISGLINLANTGRGVLINSGATGSEIGGIAAGEGNMIANNLQGGVEVNAALTVDNRILGNSIYDHPVEGIKLSGGNNLQTAPVLTGFTTGPTSTIFGTFNSAANTTYRLEFFTSPTSSQGKTLIGVSNITTDGTGAYIVNETFAVTINAGEPVITATATDPNGNTSPFGTEAVLSNEILTFSVQEVNSRSARLSWELADGPEEYYFEIQHQISGQGFQTIGEQASYLNQGSNRSYQYDVQNLPSGTHQFRLLQIGQNGQRSLSQTLSLEIVQDLPFELFFENPVSNSSELHLILAEDQYVDLVVYDTQGQKVAILFQGVLQAGITHDIPLNKIENIGPGMYFLNLSGTYFKSSRKILRK